MVLALFLAVLGAAMGIFRDAQIPPRGEPVPASAESALVAAELAARPGSDIAPVLLVATRPDGAALSATDEKALAGLTARVAPTDLPPVGPPTATVSADGRAAYTLIPVRTGAENSDNIATITDLRAEVDKATPAGLDVVVTGGPAFGADIANAFSGADFRLLAVTVGVVAVLLLITYRSPILWLIPLTVVGVADQLAGVVTKAVGDASGLTFDAGIVSVLVFGAGTNYALLLISRYREELAREADHSPCCSRSSPALAASGSPEQPGSSSRLRLPPSSSRPRLPSWVGGSSGPSFPSPVCRPLATAGGRVSGIGSPRNRAASSPVPSSSWRSSPRG